MLDVCLRCRIQADHQPGRTTCPRCGGPLTVLDAATRRPVTPPDAAPRPEPAPPRAPGPQMRGPREQPTVAAQRPAARPPARPARPALRWTAHRPWNTLPAPRPAAPAPRAGTPRYPQIPGWGLFDDVAPAAAETAAQAPDSRLRRCLQMVWPILAVAAALQLVRYVVLMVNRSRPIPYWIDIASLWLVLLSGAAAVAAAVVAVYVFVRWMVAVRERSYALAGYAAPRRRWEVIALTVIPFVNVVGAPLLLLEAAEAVGGAQAARARRLITRVAVAWALVSAIGLIALVYRIVAWSGDTVQVGADAMVWATLSLAVSAVFVAWFESRVSRVVVTDTGADTGEPAPRRLVVAA